MKNMFQFNKTKDRHIIQHGSVWYYKPIKVHLHLHFWIW